MIVGVVLNNNDYENFRYNKMSEKGRSFYFLFLVAFSLISWFIFGFLLNNKDIEDDVCVSIDEIESVDNNLCIESNDTAIIQIKL